MGYIADRIVNDYRREQYFKKKVKRQPCKDKKCTECSLSSICEDTEVVDEDCNK